MKKLISLLMTGLISGCLFCLPATGKAESSKEILFIGNSYTTSNNLPLIIQQAAESLQEKMSFELLSRGGYRLYNHALLNSTYGTIAHKSWYAVVLQEQSQYPAFDQWQLEQDVFPYARSLSEAVHRDNCTRLLFFQTWGRKSGDQFNCPHLPAVCTFDGMNQRLQNTYLAMAEENNGEVVPVGAVWKYVRDAHPEIELYTQDGSHPSLAGSYLAAMTFCAAIYQADPRHIEYFSRLDKETARILQQAAYTVTIRALDQWFLNQNLNRTDCQSLPVTTSGSASVTRIPATGRNALSDSAVLSAVCRWGGLLVFLSLGFNGLQLSLESFTTIFL